MARDLQIRVYRQRKLLQSLAVCPPLEIGRQRPGEPGPIHLDARGSRLIVAAIDEKLISRQHLRLSSLIGDGERAPSVEICNLSQKRSLMLEGRGKLEPQQCIQLEPPFLISMGELAIRVESPTEVPDGEGEILSLAQPVMIPGSPLTDELGPRTTMKWIRHVMDVLSESVLAFDGVVVDYIGDELMAMWGAPKPQPDHAYQACLAANAMLQCKVKIDAAWLERIGRPIQLRIGISSGLASVGNTGSQRRLKYGPLGNTVNLASRLQSAAKQLGVTQLISHSSASQLPQPGRLALRPLGTASFVNMDQPLPVYEPGPAEDKGFVSLAKDWEQLVRLLRTDQFSAAETLLQQMVHSFPDDRPTRILTQRLRHGDIRPDCIWPLAIK